MGQVYPKPLRMGMRFNFSSPLGMGRVTGKYMGVGDEDGEDKTRPHPTLLPCLLTRRLTMHRSPMPWSTTYFARYNVKLWLSWSKFVSSKRLNRIVGRSSHRLPKDIFPHHVSGGGGVIALQGQDFPKTLWAWDLQAEDRATRDLLDDLLNKEFFLSHSLSFAEIGSILSFSLSLKFFVRLYTRSE